VPLLANLTVIQGVDVAPAHRPDTSAIRASTSVGASGVKTASTGNLVTTPRPTQEPIAAVVNDQTISLAKLDREVKRGLEGLIALGEPQPADPQAYRLTVLDAMIEQSLIEQAATIQGIAVTEAEVEAEINANIALAGSREKWLAQVATNGMTEAEAREKLRSTLITQKMRDRVTASIGNTAEQVHSRHILVTDEDRQRSSGETQIRNRICAISRSIFARRDHQADRWRPGLVLTGRIVAESCRRFGFFIAR
jgi:parvulin-like peptidyl-prolyl isomerase